MATAVVNVGFGFGASYAWFLCFWALNGLLQARGSRWSADRGKPLNFSPSLDVVLALAGLRARPFPCQGARQSIPGTFPGTDVHPRQCVVMRMACLQPLRLHTFTPSVRISGAALSLSTRGFCPEVC